MFYNEEQAIEACSEKPYLIFELIRYGYFKAVSQLMKKNKIDVNLCDSVGNDVVTKLLKSRQYDLVLELMSNRNWNFNHQNNEGDTFAHILASDNSPMTIAIIKTLLKKKNYDPNIKNNKGETAFLKAINNNYLSLAFSMLEDKRFVSIDINAFRMLCNNCINNTCYGTYSRLTNLNIIVDSLDKKELMPCMQELINKIKEHFTEITNNLGKKNGFSILDDIITSSIEAA